MNDTLGDRMKAYYENRTRSSLTRRSNTIIRLDGKAFHSFTKGCQRPYDRALMSVMDKTAVILCQEVQGTKLAYVQSDEISLLLTDYDDEKTDAWFDGNIQKIASVSASIATAAFNSEWYKTEKTPTFDQYALFDARAFTIPNPSEVVNYFVWRQQDATRNSIQMAAQAIFSHKELLGKSCDELQEMLFQNGINWNDYPIGCKRGRTVVRRESVTTVEYVDKRTGEHVTKPDVVRHLWVLEDPPIFTQDRSYIVKVLP